MKYETEQALRIKSLAMDVIEALMKDQSDYEQKDLKQATELFARCVCDLVNVYTNISEDHDTTLRGTVVKAKVGYNALVKDRSITRE
ncbi:hypothetical protein LCM10_16740 [Rossellomorea aquimaris]|uniref:hypothetical protein n=1 Tax=Rossellomorea aquimaris TaxID=189382 RepID=UPI001CD42A32|nr:hypothetical protein [Rossellomorea aquimaris]MCA1056632.1 hypothetical protein [Rossellomorea aquimaris]